MIVDLQSNDRWQVIDELVASLVGAGKIPPTGRDPIIAAIKKREATMTTGIGSGIALPHASTGLVSDIVYAMGRSKSGVNFEALDGKLVHRIVLFLVPAGQFQKHLHTLADMAKLVHTIDFEEPL